jgi:hypothetical protein
MTIFSRLTLGAAFLALAAWAFAAPPRVTGNRPVVIDVPVPDADPPAGEPAEARPREGGLLAALVQPESETTTGDKTRTPAAELKRARELLLKSSSVSASVVETVTLFDKNYKAEGKYLQRIEPGPNKWYMRLELRIKIGESSGSLMEVCDGTILWTRTDIDYGKKRERRDRKETTLTRRDVVEIMSAARKVGDQKREASLIASFGLGGLPALLAAVEQDMKFNPEMKEGTLRDRPVTVITGTWTDAFAARLRGQGAQGAASLFPPFVPDSVRLSIDRETGFPHQILYLKKLPGRKVSRPLLTLDFLDVALNEPINSSEFDYSAPEGVTPIEQTKEIVERILPSDTRTQPAAPQR